MDWLKYLQRSASWGYVNPEWRARVYRMLHTGNYANIYPQVIRSWALIFAAMLTSVAGMIISAIALLVMALSWMDTEQFLEKIKVLSPKLGDIIVLRTEPMTGAQFDDLLMQFRSRGHGNLLLVLHDDSDIYTLDEDTMKKAGWVRA